ncbi:hypothetical protein IST4116A_01230 [Burkholderia cenocepacia]|nr:hypothetical protein IST4116B_01222 [Burkholderia cenocepacia]CAB5083977.1 hypothetical protein IST4134_01231 [Burkholderia cenocepacia]CAB5088023.1 hypothetical protein IST4113_01229 [Burkholderia cenocepacia]CAB5096074.1 hypothetical protein IST439_01269 [Burkholderia cenocepacia]CAB5105522.1 hypothetical protein IST4129_01230 [Burkholderia cenocepacia]
MFKNRIGGAAALLSQLLPLQRGTPITMTGAAASTKKPARKVSRVTASIAGRQPKGGTPKLKRPRTPADFDAILRAQAKRERKAAKLERDNFVQRCTYYVTRDAAVAEEARRVHDLLPQRAA